MQRTVHIVFVYQPFMWHNYDVRLQRGEGEQVGAILSSKVVSLICSGDEKSDPGF